MDTKVGVFLLAGNRLLREALTRILNKRTDIRVIEAVPFSPGVWERVTYTKPDVLLSDSVATGVPDLRLLQKLTRTLAEVKVVLIGMKEDEDVFLATVRAGIAGYVLDDASAMDVVAAVRAVAQGEAVCPPRLSRVLFRYVAQQAALLPNVQVRLRLGLTRRERQLIPMIAEGLTNKEIAHQLNLSEQTIKNHVHRMLRKAGAEDRLRIVEMCGLPPRPVA